MSGLTAFGVKNRFKIDVGMEVYLQFDGGGNGKERFLGGVGGKIIDIQDDFITIFERAHSYGENLNFPDKVVYVQTKSIIGLSRSPIQNEV